MIRIDIVKLATYSSMSKRGHTRLTELALFYNVPEKKVYSLFGMYLARIIRDRVTASVKSQRLNNRPMKNIYKPLSDSYNRSKPKNTKDHFWENTKWLISNFKVFEYKDRIFIGYKPGTKHPLSKVEANELIMWLEKGTSKIPARPLFTPTLRYVARNITTYWNTFCDIVRKEGLLKR